MQVDWIGMMPLPREHSHSVMKDIASTLDSLVEPLGSMAFFVNLNRKSLAATVVYRFNKSNIELVWMLRQVMGT